MCELFAMSADRPVSLSLSMKRLAARGAPGGKLADGWGAACYDGFDARVLREPEPAGASPWLEQVILAGRPHSHLVIAHIRHATQGAIALANTQPFARELGGRMHVFAHNGMLPGVEQALGQECRRFRPIGETDSEVAFSALLERMAPLWEESVPSAEARMSVVETFAARLRELGPANFLYADGDLLFAHGHRRTQADGVIAPPGLTWLEHRADAADDELPESGVTLGPDAGGKTLILFASVPLSHENWRPLEEGELVVVKDGARLSAGRRSPPL